MRTIPILDATASDVTVGRHSIWSPSLGVKVPFQWGGTIAKYGHDEERTAVEATLPHEIAILRALAAEGMAPPIGDCVFVETLISNHPGGWHADPWGAYGYEMADANALPRGRFSLDRMCQLLISGSSGAWGDVAKPGNVVNGYLVDVRRSARDMLRWTGPELPAIPRVTEDPAALARDVHRLCQFPPGERDLAYQDFWLGGEWQRGQRRVVERAALLGFNPRPGESVLEIGCQSGGFLQLAAMQGADPVLGAEVNADYVDCARRLARDARQNICIRQMDAVAERAALLDWVRARCPGGIDHLLLLSMEKHLGHAAMFDLIDALAARQVYIETNAVAPDDGTGPAPAGPMKLLIDVLERGGRHVGNSRDRNLRRLYRIDQGGAPMIRVIALMLIGVIARGDTMFAVHLPSSPPPNPTAIIMGPTERGPVDEAVLVHSAAEYEATFGGYLRGSLGGLSVQQPDTSPSVLHALDAFSANGGAGAYIRRVISGTAATASLLLPAIDGMSNIEIDATSPGAWANSSIATINNLTTNFGLWAVVAPASSYASSADWGFDPNVVPTWPAPDPSTVDPAYQSAIEVRFFVVYTAPGTQDVQVVEDWDRLSMDPESPRYAPTILQRSLYIRWEPDNVQLPAAWACYGNNAFDGPPDAASCIQVIGSVNTALQNGTGDEVVTHVGGDFTTAAQPSDYDLSVLDGISDAGILLVPQLPQFVGDTGDRHSDVLNAAAIAYANARDDLVYLGAPARQTESGSALDGANAVAADLYGAGIASGDRALIYWPWLRVTDPAPGGSSLYVEPTAAVAGLWASGAAGWKRIRGDVLDAEFAILDSDHDVLQVLRDAGVDAVRTRHPAPSTTTSGTFHHGIEIAERATGG